MARASARCGELQFTVVVLPIFCRLKTGSSTINRAPHCSPAWRFGRVKKRKIEYMDAPQQMKNCRASARERCLLPRVFPFEKQKLHEPPGFTRISFSR